MITRTEAHEMNLDAAGREIESREAQGEDMSRAYVDEKTYAILFAPLDYSSYCTQAQARGFQAIKEATFNALLKAGFTFNSQGELTI
jgi:hypothetical protein